MEQPYKGVTASKITKDKWQQGQCEGWKVPPNITVKDCIRYSFELHRAEYEELLNK